MQLSIVILNYNVRFFLELCLKSVEAAIADLDAEIIVVDNHSDDNSCEMVKELFPKVILIENLKNFGFSKGNNIGVTKAKGDYVCILNPDTVVAEDTFKILLDFAITTPNVGIVGCKLIDGSGQFLPESKRNVPTPLVSIQKILGNSKFYYANHVKEDAIGKVSILVGAFMILKRSIYNDIDGFDEDYFMYGEDLDLSYRIEKAGYQNYYNPLTTIIHFKGESTLRDKVYAKRFNEAIQIFFRKHFKPNIFYNTLITVGIKGITLITRKQNLKKIDFSTYLLVSNSISEQLNSALEKEVVLFNVESGKIDGQRFILDNNFLSFKSIIEFIINSSKNSNSTYRILPKNSQFIIGSDSSIGRGEVLEF